MIVEPSIWVQAKSIRIEKAKNHPRRMASESPYILSGRLTCSKCGRPMNGRLCRNGKYENRYYACTGYLQFRDCDCLTVRQERIEAAVLAHLLPLLDKSELNRRLTARVDTTIDQLNQEVAGLDSRLREIDQQVARVRQDYRQGLIDAQTFNELRAEIEADRASLSASLSAMRSELISAEASARLGEELRQAVDLLRAWDGITPAQRRQVVHLLTESVEFDYQTATVKVSTAV